MVPLVIVSNAIRTMGRVSRAAVLAPRPLKDFCTGSLVGQKSSLLDCPDSIVGGKLYLRRAHPELSSRRLLAAAGGGAVLLAGAAAVIAVRARG